MATNPDEFPRLIIRSFHYLVVASTVMIMIDDLDEKWCSEGQNVVFRGTEF